MVFNSDSAAPQFAWHPEGLLQLNSPSVPPKGKDWRLWKTHTRVVVSVSAFSSCSSGCGIRGMLTKEPIFTAVAAAIAAASLAGGERRECR